MISSGKMVALLAVIVMTALSVRGQAPANCSAPDATAKKQFCSNCVQGVKCITAGQPPTLITSIKCSTTKQVCDIVSDVATCVDVSKQTDCTCSPKVKCDAFDEKMVLVCDDKGPSLVYACKTGETCSNGACAPTPSPETTVALTSLCTADTENSYVPVPPECNSAVFCTAAGSPPAAEVNCDPGQYFEPDINDCATAPPVPCAGTCRGNCPDKTDCGIYHVCDGSGKLQDTQACPTDEPYFDPANETCGTVQSKCSPLTECTYDVGSTVSPKYNTTVDPKTSTKVTPNNSTTSGATTGSVTTKPASCTAKNVGSRYPYTGDCKKYWACRQVSTGTYSYVVATCLGDLVFNSVTGYCDKVSNVKGC